MGKSAAANWAARWARGTGWPRDTAKPVPDRSGRNMTAGGGGVKSPDACSKCGHSNLNRTCECCRGGCRGGR